MKGPAPARPSHGRLRTIVPRLAKTIGALVLVVILCVGLLLFVMWREQLDRRYAAGAHRAARRRPDDVHVDERGRH